MRVAAFQQGNLDNLCGIYSVVNADRIINKSSKEESEKLFYEIVAYLSRKRILKESIIEGTNHKIVLKIMQELIGDRIPIQETFKRNFKSLAKWWKYSGDFLGGSRNRAIILSLGGKVNHFTVVKKLTDRRMILLDSSGTCYIPRTDCRLSFEKNKHVIYPFQCFYLGKD